MSDVRHWLFVDVSYVIFFRYHALRSWYRHAQVDGVAPKEEKLLLREPQFAVKLGRRIEETLHQLGRTYAPERTVLCFDGCRNWRKTFYPEYKRTRSRVEGFGALFAMCAERMRAQCCAPAMVELEHPELEADDIVHFLSHAVRGGDAASRITIIANDRDYVPLLALSGVEIRDLKKKEVGCPPSIPLPHFLLVKILAGDKSDNIPPVFPGCGPKTALKLAADPTRLRAKLSENDAHRVNFERNSRLVDNARLRDDHRAWLQQQCARLGVCVSEGSVPSPS